MTINLLKSAIPFGRQFSIREIADVLYPHCIRSDSEGRTFNRASATVARLLRKHRRILHIAELNHAEFHSF